ncbi:hypothetical protein BBI01_10040 [Chryseobacterium artocarpi]|uniref:Uncharacterized protein n=1 Tax=Chryseobacterium artocarpi TaxID=1414727 RepID=A0A1B8ZLH1_9FLAO|nr:hypothetical protein [Chryseobacterium artocarpi]OCA72453.1 hypothetical protein BBI01_10040 [Chryseobacterium artocarpi]
MKKITLILLTIFCVISCKQESKKDSVLTLKYSKNKNELTLIFENNTSYDIIFPAPNTLEFGDKNFKDFSTQGGKEKDFPINVHAIIQNDQFSKFYQRKLDSIRIADLSNRGMTDVINQIMPGDGDSIFYLQKNEKMKIKYKLIIKQTPPIHNYSSKFKQNYYPYSKILKGKYPEGEYLRRFSKLNFGKTKFVAQPVIEDSLFLSISQNDANK